MWSSSLQDLKNLNVSDTEIAQLVALKSAGVDDDIDPHGLLLCLDELAEADLVGGRSGQKRDRRARDPGCARRLGFLVRLTNPARARRMFALYLEHNPNDAEARNAYELLAGK